jgi:hypothetical protein
LNIEEHLKERHLNIELHRPILDFENTTATFLLYNLSGQMIGYQTYRPLGVKKIFNDPNHGRYYTYRKLPTISVWGLESYKEHEPIFIVEGIFDAARITKRNHCALATLCNTPPNDYKNWFRMLPNPTIAICDNDKAGIELAYFTDYCEIVPEGDLGDAPEDYISYLISTYAN